MLVGRLVNQRIDLFEILAELWLNRLEHSGHKLCIGGVEFREVNKRFHGLEQQIVVA